MKPVNKPQENRKKEFDLVRNRDKASRYKEIVQQRIAKIRGDYFHKRISYSEHNEKLRQQYEGKTLDRWIKYYNDYLEDSKQNLEEIRAEIRELEQEQQQNKQTVRTAHLIVLITFLALIGITYFIIEPTITGFSIGIEEKIISEETVIEEGLPIERLTQGPAEINKPVKWNKLIRLNETSDNLTVKIPKNVFNVKFNKIINEEKGEISQERVKLKVIKDLGILEEEFKDIEDEFVIEDSVKEVEVEYYTEAPRSIEREINKYSKEITIYSDIHYENIVAYTQIIEAPRNLINLYRTTNGVREQVEIVDYIDENNNNLVEKLSWIVPSLSNETYEVVIEISKAVHLNGNKELISDIYEQVYQLDDVWSEEIDSGEYVRVTFKQALDNTRDITIYPRVVSGNPKIEVYENDKTELIAEFTDIQSNEYNKVYLTNLQGSQDIFDLRILNGSIKFDHIIDPIVCTGGVCTEIFTTGNSSWPVPTGVATITGLAIGGGGGGYNSTSAGGGGSGGDLRYSSAIVVTPGENLVIIVGAGGLSGSAPPGSGGFSSIVFQNGTTALLAAGGGQGSLAAPAAQNGTSTTLDGVVTGGTGGIGGAGTGSTSAGGGGGAGGYSDNGGDGGDAGGANAGAVGAGGGGGGGGAGGSASLGGSGGGVNTTGEGANGTGGGSGSPATAGGGGSGGNSGSGVSGGLYGGGGAGTDTATGAGNGAAGVVVITYLQPVAPTNPTLIINSTTADQLNYTNETLACNFLCNDSIGDTLTYDIDWLKNGVTSVRFTSQSCVNPSYNSPDLTDDNTTKDNLWSCSINITDDGGTSSSTVFSDNVTINNYPPSANGTLDNATQSEDFAALDNLIPVTDFNANFSDIDETPNSYKIIAQTNSSTSCYLDASNNLDCSSVANAFGTDLYTFELNDSSQASVRYDWQIIVSAVNDAPTIPELNLPNNNTQIGADIFTVELNWSNSSDIENDALTYYLEIWNESATTNILYVNSSISETTNTTSDLLTFPSETADYFWRVLSNDGTDNSSDWSELRNISFSVTITNTAPSTPTGVLFNSTLAAQTNLTNENLAANFLCNDPDTSDTLTYYIDWFKGGVNQTAQRSTNSCSDPEYIGHYFDADNTTKGDVWGFEVTVCDDDNACSSVIASNNVTIENTFPNLTFVSLNETAVADSGFNIIEGGRRFIEASFLAGDPDDDLDNTTAKINISSVDSSVTFSNTSCGTPITIQTGQINYTCTVMIEYFNPAGDWHVAAEITDLSTSSAQNSSLLGNNAEGGESWFVNALTGMNLTPTSLAFPSVTANTYNITSNSDPFRIENTGNQNKLDVFVEGITMFDDNVATEAGGTFIPAENFTASPETGASCSGASCVECQPTATSGNTLVNDTARNITGVSLVRGQGNLTDIYFCLFHVPLNITLGNYSTGKGTSAEDEEDWTISVAP